MKYLNTILLVCLIGVVGFYGHKINRNQAEQRLISKVSAYSTMLITINNDCDIQTLTYPDTDLSAECGKSLGYIGKKEKALIKELKTKYGYDLDLYQLDVDAYDYGHNSKSK